MRDQLIILGGRRVLPRRDAGIGYYAALRVRNAEDLGAGTAMGAVGAAHERDCIRRIADPCGAALCLVAAGPFFMRMMQHLRLHYHGQLLQAKRDRGVGMVAARAMIMAYIGWTGSQLVALGYILHSLASIGTVDPPWPLRDAHGRMVSLRDRLGILTPLDCGSRLAVDAPVPSKPPPRS